MNIFISYRQSDSKAESRWIFRHLKQHVDAGQIFFDVDSIPYGVNFKTYLQDAVANCDIMLVVVGPSWLSVVDDSGERRIDDPADFVRIELESALRLGIRILPVLVGDASIPKTRELPESIREFSFQQGLTVDFGKDLDAHLERLVTAVKLMGDASIDTAPFTTPPEATPEPRQVRASEITPQARPSSANWALTSQAALRIFDDKANRFVAHLAGLLARSCFDPVHNRHSSLVIAAGDAGRQGAFSSVMTALSLERVAQDVNDAIEDSIKWARRYATQCIGLNHSKLNHEWTDDDLVLTRALENRFNQMAGNVVTQALSDWFVDLGDLQHWTRVIFGETRGSSPDKGAMSVLSDQGTGSSLSGFFASIDPKGISTSQHGPESRGRFKQPSVSIHGVEHFKSEQWSRSLRRFFVSSDKASETIEAGWRDFFRVSIAIWREDLVVGKCPTQAGNAIKYLESQLESFR